jgi:ribosomal protein L29
MATTLTITELSKMDTADLQREIAGQRMLVQKMRMGITMKKEKDSALYRREKKTLARMQTVLTRKMHEKPSSTPLKTADKSSTVSPRSQKSSRSKAA